MATRKIVPRADNEGGLGTALKQWASGWIKVLTVTTINALTLAAASIGFTIAGGTTSKTLTVTASTALDEAVSMSSKLTIPGAWTTPSFDAADFTGGGSQTWTVEEADVKTFAYLIVGKLLFLNFRIISTSVGGTPNGELKIKIPASKTNTKFFITPCIIDDAGTAAVGQVIVANGSTFISIYKIPYTSTWTGSTNTTGVHGMLSFEID